MKKAQYDDVPVAVPRMWLKDWMLSIWVCVFGHSLGTIQPFRWVMFRELSARERMALAEQMGH